MLDFTDKLILGNSYKSRELHPLTSAPSWGRVTTFSENVFSVSVTRGFLWKSFYCSKKTVPGWKNFTIMFMILMNIIHWVIWRTAMALERLSLAKAMCCAFGIILFRGYKNRNQVFSLHGVLKSRCFWSWLKRMSEERVIEVTVMLNGECAKLRSKASRTWDRRRQGWAQAVIKVLETAFDFGSFECMDFSLFLPESAELPLA